MNKVYERTENGVTAIVSVREGLAEVNEAMMVGKRNVSRMSSADGDHHIEYKDGRTVRLIAVDAPAEEEGAKEWSGTASRGAHLHRFGANGRARCSARISPKSWQGQGVILRTRKEIESGAHADLYTFCPNCAAH